MAGSQEGIPVEVRHSSLGESLSHCSSTVGLDEQRQSMVLELYYTKTERNKECRKREASHGPMERRDREGEKEG
jgi:hypothetical protein